MNELQKSYQELINSLDGFNWYIVSYGEKCYAYAVVEAVPFDEDIDSPPSGTWLRHHPEKENLYISENGVEMMIMSEICSVERQSGGAICEFIAKAFRSVNIQEL